MKRYLIYLAVGLNLVVGLNDAKSATYYVKPTGSNSNSGLSEALAWQTVKKACQTVSAGDTVFIRSGYYVETTSAVTGGAWGYSGVQAGMCPSNNGSYGNEIVFKGYPGDTRPIYLGHSAPEEPNSTWRVGALLTSKNYIVYDSIEFRAGPAGIYLHSNTAPIGIIVKNCIIDSTLGPSPATGSADNNTGGIFSYVNGWGEDGHAALNCVFDNNEIYCTGSWDQADGTPNYNYGGLTGGIYLYGCDSCYIRNNRIHDTEVGIKFKEEAYFTEVSYNTVYNVSEDAFACRFGQTGMFGHGSGHVLNRWHHNIAWNFGTCFLLCTGATGGDHDDTLLYVYNNTCDCSNSVTWAAHSGTAQIGGVNGREGGLNKAYFMNNIFYKVPTFSNAAADDHTGAFILWENTWPISLIYEDYNMMWRTGGTGAFYEIGSGSGYTLAQWRTASISQMVSGQGAHDTIADPLFVDAANHDYHLAANSPAKSGGKSGTFTFFGGTARAETIDIPTYMGALAPSSGDTLPTRRANPLNAALDSMSTIDDRSQYLCGMDDVSGTDADTITIASGWKVVIWSGAVAEAIKVKRHDSGTKLILYNSVDHGLRSNDLAIDTTDPGNTWNTTADEYSQYKKVATDSSKSYYSLFYHFDEATKVLIYPHPSGGYTYYDTINFVGCTMPISDDDSSSIVPDSYTGQFFTGATLDTVSVDTVSTNIYRAFNYQGTPQGSKVTRVYLDFSNPLARYAELRYSTRMFAANLKNLGGTGNDVYGWGMLSDSSLYWDGVYYDNSSDESNQSPAGMTIISGGNIRCSRGVIGKWNADSTRSKMNSHQKEFFAYITDYCNNAANFSNGVARITAANFGTWAENSSRNPITTWYNDSNRINLKLLEFPRIDGGYSSEAAYEGSTPLGYSVAQLKVMDSLARANDFYVLFAGRINYTDTTVASGWSVMKDAFLRSNFVRLKSIMGHRALMAMNPEFALTASYLPCSSSGGTAYGGMIYNTPCDDRSEVDLYTSLTKLPFMSSYDFGKKDVDTGIVSISATDSSGASVTIYKTFWRKVNGSDTTYSYMYYFPRTSTSWEWRKSGLHAVRLTPPASTFKRLEYDGTLTDIGGASQLCWIGDQLILSRTSAGDSTPPASILTLHGSVYKGAIIK